MIQKYFFSSFSNRFFSFLVMVGVFLYGGFTLYQTRQLLQRGAHEEMLMLYELSKKMDAHALLNPLVVENEMYENQKEFFDEYQKITPYSTNKALERTLPFTLSIRFFTPKTLPEFLRTEYEALGEKEHVYRFDASSLTLFGTFADKQWVFIQKDARHVHVLDQKMEHLILSLAIVFFLTVGMIVFSSYEAWMYRKKKETIESEYVHLEEDAKKLAFVDALTGVASRLKLAQSLNDLIENAKRFYQPFSLILCDLDSFKRINDTHGHDYGDVVLKRVAHTLQESLRSSDITARWGGEEFLMVLPMTHLKCAIRTAEKLRRNIEALSFEKIPFITCSFGVVEYAIGEDEAALFKRVDTLLYEAKTAGRNCIKYEKKDKLWSKTFF
ncbi:GGDEF domain-containing protein [Sulfurospirillum barnesii]|uniref:diguanylate cyclase n=1 Tax=Sulfurospirillum barnesii (strain ATCC 700032 / DSM 10660 / SES-3) TaxID=760154 RepID=I3XY81_SULBS|nr:GGDEF domain-containing protein [Sulfurospirillum barnesii]AFL68905.1 diguanylate cyclase (GGDEF) domain-containing protein [Sulfurospirillum barnesii SES-3]